LDYDVHVVRHDYPCREVVRASLAFSISQRFDKHVCDSGVSQPSGAKLSSVQFPIKGGEGFAGSWTVFPELGWWYWNGAGKAPGYENCLAFGTIVGQMSLAENKGAGGKTASGT